MTAPSSARTELVDTNILVYAHDIAEPVKQRRSQELIRQLLRRDAFTISVQSLNEFYRVVSKPAHSRLMYPEYGVNAVRTIAQAAHVLPLTAEISLLAMNACERYRMSIWDSLIWAVAKYNGMSIIYTEDTQSAGAIEGIHYVNPFA